MPIIDKDLLGWSIIIALVRRVCYLNFGNGSTHSTLVESLRRVISTLHRRCPVDAKVISTRVRILVSLEMQNAGLPP